MELTNPAVAQQTILSPKDLSDIRDNPALMEVVARGMGAVNLDNLFRIMQNPDVPVAHKLEFQKMLNKMGRLEPGVDAANAGSKFSINIVIPGSESGVTVEGVASQVAADE